MDKSPSHDAMIQVIWCNLSEETEDSLFSNGRVSDMPRRLPRHQRAQAHNSTLYGCKAKLRADGPVFRPEKNRSQKPAKIRTIRGFYKD
jgi:hypothetical protein